ncbi:MAG TPA: AzlC family ABC transporter permease [Acidimicrobiales bacterium]|nr:AzlC family ABC transporter permease [Acidimicrobiales bacterium]
MRSRDEVSSAFHDGVIAMAPLALGVAPFGLVVGVTAADQGLSVLDAAGMSVLVFAGASQLAAIDLLGEGAPLLVVVGTALVINLRMLMYSASIGPHVTDVSFRGRLAMTYLLVDQDYALSIVRWETRRETARAKLAYFLGVGIPLWVIWQVATVLGALFGGEVPDAIPLEFTITLVFLAILIPVLTDRPRVLAALVAGSVAIAANSLPANLALVVGSVSGIVAGAAAEARWGR